MSKKTCFSRTLQPLLSVMLTLCGELSAADPAPVLLHAARVFDGYALHADTSVLLRNGKVERIDRPEAFEGLAVKNIELGDATLLPGLIELHAHLTFRQVPADVVLRHGITSVRDVGGPLHQPYGGDGRLRLMTSGPILTAPSGYPIPGMGETDIAIALVDEQHARETVRRLIKGGAVVIKVALEPGGEAGAPWSDGHAHAHSHQHEPSHQDSAGWPLLSESIVKAIVDEAHLQNRKVTAHLAEAKGAQRALNAGIDEWAHTPCEALPDALLKQAVAQGVKVVSTLDTLSKCPGIASNVQRLTSFGGALLYGAEIAHPDIPWGIDGQELLSLQRLTGKPALEILRTATATAGEYLNLPLLGTLLPGAPADLIAVRGDVLQNLKALEYPDLVISGGQIVVDRFSQGQ